MFFQQSPASWRKEKTEVEHLVVILMFLILLIVLLIVIHRVMR